MIGIETAVPHTNGAESVWYRPQPGHELEFLTTAVKEIRF